MFERSRSFQIPANAGALCINSPDFTMPGGDPLLQLEAWKTGPANMANVFIFEGEVLLAEAQQRLLPPALVDCLMVVPMGGVGVVRIPLISAFTVFFDQNIAAPQAVTMRVREIPRGR